jgi:cell division protein FtsN
VRRQPRGSALPRRGHRPLLFLLGSLLLCASARGKGLVVGPARIELTLAPGEIRVTTISVTNTDTVGQLFRLTLMNFTLTEVGDLSYDVKVQPRFPIQSWIDINPEEVDIAGQQAATIRVRVRAPSEASGTIWGGVLVSMPATGRAVGGFGVTTEPRVFIPVYLTVSGTQKSAAEVASFQAVRDREGVFHFRASLRNRGNTMLRPAGTWLLEEKTPRGPVELLVVPFSGEPVLPGLVRRFEGEGRGKVSGTDLAASVFFDYGTAKGEIVSATGPVAPAQSAPVRETRSVASAVIPARDVSKGGSAARTVRVAMERGAIRLDAGETIQYRSEVRSSPPGLLLELVGYRIAGPPVYQGRKLVERLEAREVNARPVTTRLEVRFRVPVTAQIHEEPYGLRISLEPEARAPAPASAAPMPVVVKQEPAPVAVKQEPTRVAMKQEPTPAAVKQEPTPIAVKQEPTRVAVKQEPAPVPVKQEPTPIAVKQEPTRVAMKQAATPVAVKQEPTPIAVKQEPTRVAAKQEPTPVTVKQERPPPSPAGSGKPSAAAARGGYAVQVAAFALAESADEVRDRLSRAGFAVIQKTVVDRGRSLVVVLVGPFGDREATDAARRKLLALGVGEGVVRRLP